MSRGVFETRRGTKFRDILDGLANTIAMGEIITDLGVRDIRAAAWWDGGGAGQAVNGNPSYCKNVDNETSPEKPTKWCASGDANCNVPQRLGSDTFQSRGACWANFRFHTTEVFTILPPNREVCIGQWLDAPGTMPPSSNHQGGAHVLMSDGAVVFITDSIEAGDSTAGGVRLGRPGPRQPGSESPYGLWGALGSKAAKETIEEQLNQ